MEVILLVGILFNSGILLFLLWKESRNRQEKEDVIERLGRFELNITKSMNQEFDGLKEKMEERLDKIQ